MDNCCIIYGTETGSAENAAYNTYFQLYRGGIDVNIIIASRVKIQELSNYKYTIFFVSTAAYGEFPCNFQQFVDDLSDYNPKLNDYTLNYTIFGLGDSRYPLYNYAARRLHYIFKSFYFKEFFRVSFGDDQHPLGYDGELIPWRSDLLSFFNVDIIISLPQLPLDVRENDLPVSQLIKPQFNIGKVTCNKIITSKDHFRNVNIIKITGQYNTGDVCCLLPVDDNVDELLYNLNLNPNHSIIISRNASTFNTINTIHMNPNTKSNVRLIPLNTTITLHTIFKRFLCLRNLCTRYQMYIMSLYTSDDLHKNKLLELSSDTIEGSLEYYRYCKKERRSFYDVLFDFPSVKLPLDVLINISSPYYPRMYSISSHCYNNISIQLFNIIYTSIDYSLFKKFLCNYIRNNEMELCIVDVHHETPNRDVDGLCCKYLTKSSVGDEIEYYIYKSPYSNILLDINLPVLFICTGTGIAACKPYIEGRIHKFCNLWNDYKRLPLIKDLAYFGFRRPNQDNLYCTNVELLKYWCRINYVYSRVSQGKYYVQDAIAKDSKIVCWRVRTPLH